MAVRLTVPVTIVTGFLGSGKTTLVNRFLAEPAGERIAVIENEFGEVGLDAEFLARTGSETIIELANGCLCCTVRGDLANALGELAGQAVATGTALDRVVIETSGLADPGPVIQTFLAETAIQASFHLDGVVTVIDAGHAAAQIGRPEFDAQLGYADRLLVSKVDRIGAAELAALGDRLGELNSRAPVIGCNLHASPIEALRDQVFEIRGFAGDYVAPEELKRAQGWLARVGEAGTDDEEGRGGEGDEGREGGGWRRWRRLGAGRHDGRVTAVTLVIDEAIDLARLNAALDSLVAVHGDRLWRCKGVVQIAGLRSRLVLQGVQRAIQLQGGMMWRPFEARRTTLVFIGRDLDPPGIEGLIRACIDGALPACPSPLTVSGSTGRGRSSTVSSSAFSSSSVSSSSGNRPAV